MDDTRSRLTIVPAHQFAVVEANFEPDPYAILSPRSQEEFASLKDSQQRYLARPTDLASYTFLGTTQVPNTDTQGTSTQSSAVYLGSFGNLWIGMRTSLTIQPLLERFSDNLQVGFLAYFRMDVQCAHPEAFCVVKGLN